MNRDCNTIFAMLSEYLDRDLAPADCEELERHIQSCEPCVAFVDSLKKSVSLGQAYSPGTEPPPLAPETKQSLKEAYEKMLAARQQQQ
ncbi:MAG: zf-HC2 domain-containing protein [Bryobacteraceae bacterium]